MDTSKQYINMCEMAVEIQDLWESKWKTGDYFCDGQFVCICLDNDLDRLEELKELDYDENTFKNMKFSVWLPRQDQLQGMIIDDTEPYPYLYWSRKFYDYINVTLGAGQYAGNSMEQLWLAFVMMEKFNKIWDGKDWI